MLFLVGGFPDLAYNCPFVIKNQAINQLLCDPLCGLSFMKVDGLASECGIFFHWGFPISLQNIATNPCIYLFCGKTGSRMAERRERRDERKRLLVGRMPEAHGTCEWLVAPYTGFQILFPALYLTLILCPTRNPTCCQVLQNQLSLFHGFSYERLLFCHV